MRVHRLITKWMTVRFTSLTSIPGIIKLCYTSLCLIYSTSYQSASQFLWSRYILQKPHYFLSFWNSLGYIYFRFISFQFDQLMLFLQPTMRLTSFVMLLLLVSSVSSYEIFDRFESLDFFINFFCFFSVMSVNRSSSTPSFCCDFQKWTHPQRTTAPAKSLAAPTAHNCNEKCGCET